jgi:hypothetical protein
MRKLSFIFVLLWATFASASLNYVGAAGGYSASGGTVTISHVCTSGNLMLMFIGDDSSGTVTPPTDTVGNQWQLLGKLTSTSWSDAWVYFVGSCTGGANTITVVATQRVTVALAEYSGVGEYCPVVTQAFAMSNNSGSKSLAVGPVTVQSNSFLAAFAFAEYDFASPGTDVYSAPGFTARFKETNSNVGTVGILDIAESSAGSYSATITDTATPRGYQLALIGFTSNTDAHCAQSTVGKVASATSLSVPLLKNTGAGNAVIASVSTTGNVAPTSVTICGSTAYALINTGWVGSYNDMGVYFVQNVSAAACTVVATFAGTQQINITATEYTGLPASYIFESQIASVARGGSNFNLSLATSGNNSATYDVWYAFNDENHAGTTCTGSTGFTQRTTPLANSSSTTIVFDDDGGGAATYTNYPTCSGAGTNLTGIMVVIRSALPVIGRLQYAPFTTSASQTLPLPVNAGDTLIAMCRADVLPTDANNTWIALPVTMESDAGSFYRVAMVINASGSTGAVACSGATGMELFEFTGVDMVSPLAGSSAFFSDSASSTVNAGPVPIFSPGILFSVAGALAVTNITFTGGSGFVPFSYMNLTDSVQVWDQVVSAGSYSNAVTASGSMGYQNAFTLALSSVKVQYPVLRQHHRRSGGIGGDGSFTVTLPSPVVAGDLILIATASAASSGTISDNQYNVYSLLEGGGSNIWGLWWTIASASGSLSTNSTSAQCVASMEFSGVNAPTVDQKNSGSSSTATVNTGSITTTKANELIVAAGYAYDSAASYRLLFSSMDSGWSGVLFACGGHYNGVFAGYQTQAAIGTYYNDFTWSHTMALDGAIVSFIGAPSTTVQPVVSIITENLRELNAILGAGN